MRLGKINEILNFFNLVLVVEHWDGKGDVTPTKLYIRSYRAYLRDINKVKRNYS